MKLRLPHQLQTAILTAFASLSFTTISSGTLAAAFFLGSHAFADDSTEEAAATIDIGDTNLDAQAAMDEEEGKGEAKEPGSTPINHAGFNGVHGSSDQGVLNPTVSVSEAGTDTASVTATVSGQAASDSVDSTPADDLGFTTQVTDGTTSAASAPVFQMPTAAPAVQPVLAVQTATQGTTTTTTSTTSSTKSSLGVSAFSLGSPAGISGGGYFATPALAAAPLVGAVGEVALTKVISMKDMVTPATNHNAMVNATQTMSDGSHIYDFSSSAYIGGFSNNALTTALNSAATSPGNYVTIAAWINPTNPTSNQNAGIFGYGAQGNGIKLTYMVDQGSRKLRFTTKGIKDFTGSGAITSSDQWQLVAVTFGYNESSGTLDVYYMVDGKFSTQAAGNAGNMGTASPATFAIGSSKSDGAWESFNGSIGGLTVFTSTGLVTGEDVQAVMGTVQAKSIFEWNGTSASYNWNNHVWNKGEEQGVEFVSGENAVFADNGANTTVDITTNVIAHAVTVSGHDYTFNVNSGGSLKAAVYTTAAGSSSTISGEGSVEFTTLTNNGGTVSISAPATITTLNANGGTTTLESGTVGALAGSGVLVKSGTGDLTVSGNNTGYTGNITVNGGTLKLNSDQALGQNNVSQESTRTITINQGGTIDLNGKDNGQYAYILSGGSLVNNWADTSENHAQTTKLKLTEDSSIGGTKKFYLLASGWGDTSVDMGGKVLEKTGSNEIVMWSTNVTNGGTILIRDGSLNIARHDDQKTMSSVNANIVLSRAGTDSLKGNFSLAGNHTISSTVEDARMSANVALQGATTLETGESHSLTMSGALTGSGSITKTGEGTVTLSSTSNSYTGTTTVDGGTLSVAKLGSGAVTVTAGTLDLTATMTTGNLTVGNGATLKLAAAERALTVNGDLTLNSGSELDVSRLDSLYAANKSVTLATYTGTGTSEGVALTGLEAGHSAYLTNDTTNKALILTFVATLNWNGTDDNHTWVDGSGDAWQGGTVFHNGAGVSFSSSTANKEVRIQSAIVAGTVTVSEDGYRFAMGSGGSLTADNLYIADKKTLTTTGNLTIRNAMGGEGNNGNLTYAGEGPGIITFQSNDGEHVKEYTGTFTNASESAVTLKFPESTQSKTFEIHFDIKRAEGAGVVNLDLFDKDTGKSEADLSVFSSSVEVNDIKHSPNVTVLVREEGALTVTGTVTTGRLVVGQADTETDAVFTLAGTSAKLNTGGTGSTFGALVQGYGTLALTEGATETLSGGLSEFHGTYKVSGENSVLTLSSAVASDAKLVAADGGVIKLTATYTMDDNSSVDGGTISVGNGLVVNGTVDLSKGTLAQTGGTVTVNQGKSLTLGNASITSAISNSGSVTFTQNITATGLTGGEKDYRVGIDGQKTTGDNYFAGAKEAYLNVVSGNGTVTIQNAPTVTQNEQVYTLGADGTASRTIQEADYTTFYHGSGALNLSDIAEAAKEHTATLAKVNMSTDTVLTINDTVGTIAVQGLGAKAKAIGTVKLTSKELDIDEGQTRLLLDGYGTLQIQGDAAVDNAVRFAAVEGSTVQINNTNDEAIGDQYRLNSNHIYVTADTVQKVGAVDVTVGNVLHGVSKVENTEASGSFTLAYMTRSDNAMDVKAQTGDIQFYGYNADANVALHNLQIAEGKGVGFYSGYVPPSGIANVANEISVTVNGTLTAGAGAKLNANVDMASGSHLDVSGAQSTMGLLMGSDVTLRSGSYLDITKDPKTGAAITVDDVSGYLYNYLASGEDKLYYLYSGTAEDKINLSINGTQRIDPLTKRSWNDYDMDASTIYANLQAQTFYLVYDGANVGTIVAIGLIPEPATGSLSLLALAALAARRRRR